MKELSYGEKAVGMKFNSSVDPRVQRIKELYAEIIDICYAERYDDYNGDRAERARLFSVAITEAQTAQLWAVEAIMWRE